VADHDSQTMNEPATKQDLYNMGVQIDSNFGKVISQFTIVDSQFNMFRADMNAGFDMFRTNMDAGFEALHATLVRKLIQMGVLNTFGMIAILAVDRWWL
jgi:hypothetical protein